tara:strand:+ start:393 stop:5411 length:5019 start_codon:yes stop_codon:yes gene_type:complete
MSQEFTSYVGTVHSSISGSSGDYLATSISLNFESDRVALSTSNVSNYTGRIEIHDYTAGYWVKKFTLSGPDGANSSFGHEISLNWSGTRLAVSAYQKNKVYIYDATGTGSNIWSSYVSNTLNTSSLSLSSGDEFGYSISLAQDDGNRIAVGAPGENKVYVYEYDSANSNWGSGPVWSIGDTGMKNLVAKTVDTDGLATAYLHAHNVSNRFGHKVRLSAFGNYLIVGAPGTIATINSSSAYDPHTSTAPYLGTAYTNQRQIGNVRCFTNDTSTWASGTTQYGQSILGKAGTAVGDNNQPAFGTSCDISTNGNKISVSSPYKKVSTLGDAGQIDTYLINDDLDTWLSVSTSIAGDKSAQKLGMNLRLDFAGERLATGDLSTVNQESAYYSGISLYALDFGTDRWYDITPPIQVHDWPTQGSTDFNPLDITNGKIIAISDPRDPPNTGTSGKVVFYQFPLTNAIQGNTSVGGYVKCENLYVGANDNSSNTDHSIPNKRISFGGTIKDNSYEETYIENRSVDGAGKSELLLYKRNDIWDKAGGNPHSTNAANMVDDSIRIKAAEICLDYEDTNLHGTYPNAATRNTRLRMNRGGQVAVGDSYHNNAAHILSPFDINCRSYFWTMVNIGNNTAKPVGRVPSIDTNNERLFENQGVSHSPIGGGKYGTQQFERRNVSSQVWDPQEYGFYFSGSNATIYSAYHPGNWHSTSCGFGCWIKLNDTPANCSGVLMWWGEDHHRAGTSYKGGQLKLVSGGLSIEYEPSSANALSVSYTFAQDTWYQIRGLVPAENVHPMSNSVDFPAIQINGVSQTITGPGEGGTSAATAYNGGINWDDSSYGFGSALTYSRNGNGDINRDNSYHQNVAIVNGDQNNGVKNCWIALMSIGDGGGHAHPDSHHIFPGELLTVAGTTTIGRHLGIRQNIPQYPLDVTGDINFTGNLRKSGVIQALGGGGSSNTFVAGPSSTAGVYPLSAMSANSSGVHVASASSENPSDWKAWKAFNQTIGDEGWHTASSTYNSGNGNYSGSTSTTYDGSSTVSGEWVQLQFTSGTGIAINKIEIAPRTGYLNRCAGDGRILGSTDGSTWTSIATFSGKTYSTGSYNSITFTTSSIYTYFRLVGTKLSGTGADVLNISEIRYTGVDIASDYIYYPETGTTSNVGINTSSPVYPLDVTGDINLTGDLRIGGVVQSFGGGGGGGSSVESDPSYFYVIVENSKFVIDGTQQPTLTLYRGVTYRFDQSSSTNGSHPFRISTTAEGGDAPGTSYNGSNGSSGSYRQYIVPDNAPNTMYYNCSNHSGMGGTINIISGITNTSGLVASNVFVNNHMGIRTVSPKRYLDVAGTRDATNGGILVRNGDDNTGGNNVPQIAFGWNGNEQYQHFIQTRHNSAAAGNAIDFYVCNSTQNNTLASGVTHNLTLESGKVGIGTTNPTQGKLVVSGHGGSTVNIGTYGWLNNSGTTNQASGSNYYSIYANSRIAATEFNAFSDSRIKKNVVDINDSSALDKIRLIEPKIYNYIDEKQRGTSNVYGFIAQEVANVLPYAVTVSTGDIPNILTNSNVSVTSDSNVLELRLDTTVEGLTLSNTSNINITTDKNKYLTVPVLTFSGSNVITIQNSDKFTNVTGAYIHGEQVSNFHHLNKDAIWAVSTAALQEVDRQLQAEKTKVVTLQTQVADLLARVTALENN